MNPDSELISVARANGITHSLIIPMGGSISGTSGLIALEGWGIEEMTIKQKVAIHLWWPGQGLSLPSHKNDSKSIKQQAEDREKAVYNIDQFFNQAETYAGSRKLTQKSKKQTSQPKLGGNDTLYQQGNPSDYSCR